MIAGRQCEAIQIFQFHRIVKSDWKSFIRHYFKGFDGNDALDFNWPALYLVEELFFEFCELDIHITDSIRVYKSAKLYDNGSIVFGIKNQFCLWRSNSFTNIWTYTFTSEPLLNLTIAWAPITTYCISIITFLSKSSSKAITTYSSAFSRWFIVGDVGHILTYFTPVIKQCLGFGAFQAMILSRSIALSALTVTWFTILLVKAIEIALAALEHRNTSLHEIKLMAMRAFKTISIAIASSAIWLASLASSIFGEWFTDIVAFRTFLYTFWIEMDVTS